jgi:hypothetical protein
MASKQVKFSYGLLENYNGLDAKDQNTVYFITDKPYIYFREVKYGLDPSEVKVKAVSSIKLGADNKTLTINYTDGTAASTIVIAEATQGTAGLMSAADKTKLDNLNDELEANTMYDSAMDDSLATVGNLGGIPAGTTAASLKAKTLSQVFDDLLFPTVNPTFEAPTASLSLKSTSTTPNIQEVGTTGASVPVEGSFNTGFNKGAIKIAGVKKQDRAGNLIPGGSFIYMNGNPSTREFPTEIPDGFITYKYRAAHEAGPQPLDSKGGNYQTPLPKGTVDSGAVTVNGVYPYYTNKDNITAFSKLALTTNKTLDVTFVAETASNKHAFKIPTKFNVTKITLLNTRSGKYEDYSVSRFSVTTETINVQGTNVQYKVYTRNDGTNGSSSFKITFA